MATYDWILGVGIAFVIAIILTIFSSFKDGNFEISGKVFFIFLPIGFAFTVYANLTHISFFIITLILAIILIYYEFKNN